MSFWCVCVCVFSTAIGIRCKDGVVFAVEKLVLSKLYEEGSNKRIFNIDRHVGMVITHTHTSHQCLFSTVDFGPALKNQKYQQWREKLPQQQVGIFSLFHQHIVQAADLPLLWLHFPLMNELMR